MIAWLRKRLEQDGTQAVEPIQKEKLSRGSLFSTHRNDSQPRSKATALTVALYETWERYTRAWAPRPVLPDGTMDDSDSGGWSGIKSAYTFGQPNMSEALFQWYGTQSFIGHQACAILSQHWMIDKICTVPARDAIRQGYEIINEVGEEKLTEEVQAAYAKYDKQFKINFHLLNYVRKGRIFGIRVALPRIESKDPDYFEKPFNPDGVTRGSFKGWIQIDPYWMAPILSAEASAQPDSPDFYEPTWWLINGKRYHRTHLCVFRTAQPPDLLKPSYLYSGVPIPQKIMERVYAAERTGNEAPLLAMTKRLYTMKLDGIDAAIADKEAFDEGMQFQIDTQDNYGTRIIGKDDELDQFDTSLADLAAVIDCQYALACAAGDTPVNKIMGTAAAGLGGSAGDYDMASYHETLESIQMHELTPFLERHHLLVKMSYIVPQFGAVDGGANTTVSWNPSDSPTAKEYSEINLNNANADLALVQTGAVDDVAVNERLRNDKNSGYSTLKPLLVSKTPELDDDAAGDVTPNNAPPADKGQESPENKASANSAGVSARSGA